MNIYSDDKITAKLRRVTDTRNQIAIVKFFDYIQNCNNQGDIMRDSHIHKMDHDVLIKRINKFFLVFTVKNDNVLLLDCVEHP